MAIAGRHGTNGRFYLPHYDQSTRIAVEQRGLILLINEIKTKTENQRGDIMAENKTQDYFDDKNEGHVDTRESNFECEKPDEHLGCDPGIDVAG